MFVFSNIGLFDSVYVQIGIWLIIQTRKVKEYEFNSTRIISVYIK